MGGRPHRVVVALVMGWLAQSSSSGRPVYRLRRPGSDLPPSCWADRDQSPLLINAVIGGVIGDLNAVRLGLIVLTALMGSR
jgi:hypothetical protein